MTLLVGGGVQESVTKWYKGEGGGLPKCHVTFYPKILSSIFAFYALFKGFLGIIFWKIKISHHSQKSVTYYLNDPLGLKLKKLGRFRVNFNTQNNHTKKMFLFTFVAKYSIFHQKRIRRVVCFTWVIAWGSNR